VDKFQLDRKISDSEFEVDVDLKIRRPGLMLRTYPAAGTEVGEDKL